MSSRKIYIYKTHRKTPLSYNLLNLQTRYTKVSFFDNLIYHIKLKLRGSK